MYAQIAKEVFGSSQPAYTSSSQIDTSHEHATFRPEHRNVTTIHRRDRATKPTASNRVTLRSSPASGQASHVEAPTAESSVPHNTNTSPQKHLDVLPRKDITVGSSDPLDHPRAERKQAPYAQPTSVDSYGHGKVDIPLQQCSAISLEHNDTQSPQESLQLATAANQALHKRIIEQEREIDRLNSLNQRLEEVKNTMFATHEEEIRDISNYTQNMEAELEKWQARAAESRRVFAAPQSTDEHILQQCRAVFTKIRSWSLQFSTDRVVDSGACPIDPTRLEEFQTIVPNLEIHKLQKLWKDSVTRKLFVRAWVGLLATNMIRRCCSIGTKTGGGYDLFLQPSTANAFKTVEDRVASSGEWNQAMLGLVSLREFVHVH